MPRLEVVPELDDFEARMDAVVSPCEKQKTVKTAVIPTMDRPSTMAILLKSKIEIPTVLFRDYQMFTQHPVTYSSLEMRLNHLLISQIDDVPRFIEPKEFKITRLAADLRLEDIILAYGLHAQQMDILWRMTASTVRKFQTFCLYSENAIHKLNNRDESLKELIKNGRVALHQLTNHIWDFPDHEVHTEKFAQARSLSQKLELAMMALEKSEDDLKNRPRSSNHSVLLKYIRRSDWIRNDVANKMKTSEHLRETFTLKTEKISELEKKFSVMWDPIVPSVLLFFSDAKQVLTMWKEKTDLFQSLIQNKMALFDNCHEKLKENTRILESLQQAKDVDKSKKTLQFLIRATKKHLSTSEHTH